MYCVLLSVTNYSEMQYADSAALLNNKCIIVNNPGAGNYRLLMISALSMNNEGAGEQTSLVWTLRINIYQTW